MANWTGSYSITAGATGTLTSADATHANNTGATWPTGAQGLPNFYIRLLTGPGSPATVPIIANTATQVTVASWPSGTPTAATTYEIVLILNDQDHIVGTTTLTTNIISELQDSATILLDGNYVLTLSGTSEIRWNKSESTLATFCANNRTVQGKAGFWTNLVVAAKLLPNPKISYIKTQDASYGLRLQGSAGLGNGSLIHHIWVEDSSSSSIYASGTALQENFTFSNAFARRCVGAELGFNITASNFVQIFEKCWVEHAPTGLNNWGGANSLEWSRDNIFKYSGATHTINVASGKEVRCSNSWHLCPDSSVVVGGASTGHAGTLSAFHNYFGSPRALYGATGTSTGSFISESNDNSTSFPSTSAYMGIMIGSATFYTSATSNFDFIAGTNAAASENIDTTASTTSTASPQQYKNLTTARTNPRSVPNFPLILDNQVVGTPTDTSISITFDCENGAQAGQSTAINVDSNSGQPTLNVVSSSPFLVGMVVEVGYGTVRAEQGRIASLGAGTITLESNLTYTHTAVQADSIKPQLRQLGLPFVEFGTSSGVYTMRSDIPIVEDWGLFYSGLKTTYRGVSYYWKKIGHSVTLNYLKPETTYYARICAYNPFGQMIEGASEFSFTTATNASYSDPGVDNVRLGTTYKYNSPTINRTGTVRVPAISEVKVGTNYDANDSLTGTYTGSDRWTDPGDNNVRNLVAYKADSLSNNKVGRVVVPVDDDVRDGVAFEVDAATIGLLDLPATSDVRLGIDFDNLTKIGDVRVPLVASVESGYSYDTLDSLTGTYTGANRWSDPGENNVRLGTNYKANSLTNNKVGNVRVPPITEVHAGYAYDSLDSLVGTFGDGTPPTFAGISGLVANADGSLTASWSTATDPNPIIYKVYIQPGTSVGLFSIPAYVTESLSLKIYADNNNIPLTNGVTYYVGVRAADTSGGGTETNIIVMSVMSLGVIQGRSFFQANGTFSIVNNMLEGTLWGTLDFNVDLVGLGAASYEIFDSIGTSTGILEVGLTPDANGMYHITPINASSLMNMHVYTVKVSIVLSGITRVSYMSLTIFTQNSVLNCKLSRIFTLENIILAQGE